MPVIFPKKTVVFQQIFGNFRPFCCNIDNFRPFSVTLGHLSNKCAKMTFEKLKQLATLGHFWQLKAMES